MTEAQLALVDELQSQADDLIEVYNNTIEDLRESYRDDEDPDWECYAISKEEYYEVFNDRYEMFLDEIEDEEVREYFYEHRNEAE